VDLTAPGRPVSPYLYGLMTEEINHSYDGGIYGELIRNRAFNEDPSRPWAWSLWGAEGERGRISLDSAHPLNPSLSNCLRVDISSASDESPVGVINSGYWGVPIHPRTTYKVVLYSRANPDFDGAVRLSLESEDGKTSYAGVVLAQPSPDWRRYEAVLTTEELPAAVKGRFAIRINKPGTLWFGYVSLFPPTWNDRSNGNRRDLMQMLVDLKPSFIRFPGGNYLQGDTAARRFDWKNTLGDVTRRPGHRGPWGYHSSDGMGLLEFLQWSEDIGAEPILAVYAGCSLRSAAVPAGPELEPYVQDALDEIEYIVGPVDSKWGARRAADGHPEPFKLNYVEIGNEDWLDRTKSYEGRYAQFHDAIRARYPKLKLIATTEVKERTPDLVDEHIYRDPSQIRAESTRYDNYDRRGPKIFVGEWAARESTATTSFLAALGDAAWLTGIERNSDVVHFACYAPLFVNVSPKAMQWKSNLIGYNALASYGSPSYYVQKMFANNLGSEIVAVHATGIPEEAWQPPADRTGKAQPSRQLPTLHYAATRDSEEGVLYLKVVNSSARACEVGLAFRGASVASEGELLVLHASPTETNSIGDPVRIVPRSSKVGGVDGSYKHAFPQHSVSVLKLRYTRK
jgi:alpha-N-arabinofuranosidase